MSIPMPRVSEEVITGYAHCEDAMCEGNAQQKVQVVRQEVEYTMRDSGGDTNQVENGFVYYRFADEGDKLCEVCGRHRAVHEQLRPVYPGSNWDPDGLKKMIKDGMSAAKGSTELDELKKQLAALQEQMKQQEPRRGPGRPPKQTQEAQ